MREFKTWEDRRPKVKPTDAEINTAAARAKHRQSIGDGEFFDLYPEELEKVTNARRARQGREKAHGGRPANVDKQGLSRREHAVRAALKRLLGKDGAGEATISEIERRSGYRRRSVQLALRRLQDLGVLEIEEQKVKRDFNRPNFFRLGGAKPACKEPPMDSIQADNTSLHQEQNCRISERPKGRNSSEGGPTRRRAEGLHDRPVDFWHGATPRPESATKPEGPPSEPAPPVPSEPLAGAEPPSPDVEIVTRALAADYVPDAETTPWPDLLAKIGHLRPGDFSQAVWASWSRRHRWRAPLAALELALMVEIKSETDDPVRDRSAYLGGILRRPVPEVRPEVTLARIFETRATEGLLPEWACGAVEARQ